MVNFESFTSAKVWDKAVMHLSRNDPAMKTLSKKHGRIRIKLHKNYYESLVSAIIAQQLAWSAANSITKKFKTLFNGNIPEPALFLKTSEKKVRSSGISPQKYSYIKDLCIRIESSQLEITKFQHMEDEAIISELDEVRGIGRWTAEMFLMFTLGRTDVVPTDDLGIRKSIKEIYGLRDLPKKDKVLKLAEKWHPYGSVACLYLWHSHDNSK